MSAVMSPSWLFCCVNGCSHPTFSLNLEQNQLTSMSGLMHLPQLKVLCLNHNRVERLAPPSELGGGVVFPSLQVLHLAYNQLSSLLPLQLHRLTALRALFLQGEGRGGEGVWVWAYSGEGGWVWV